MQSLKFLSRLTIGTGIGRFIIALLWIVGCSLPTVLYAQRSHSAEECNASNARQISVAEASRHIEKLEQACVRIAGISDGRALYGSVGDIYRDTDAWKEHRHRQWSESHIGLRQFPEIDEDDEAAPDSGTSLWSRKAPRRVTLIGWLHNCSLDWSTDDPNEISMGTGWCHYNGGAVLQPVAIVAQRPIEFIRMTGSRVRRQYGDIVPLRNDPALTDNITAFLDRLFEAVRRGDRRAVLNLYGYSEIALAPNGTEIAENELAVEADFDPPVFAQHTLKLLFGDPDTALSRDIRNGRAAVWIFVPRWKMEYEPDAWACWTAATSTEKDWPISSIDTFNVSGRPYACISFVKDGSKPEDLSVDDTVQHRPWAKAEPAGQ